MICFMDLTRLSNPLEQFGFVKSRGQMMKLQNKKKGQEKLNSLDPF
jgi:hypothetical protein